MKVTRVSFDNAVWWAKIDDEAVHLLFDDTLDFPWAAADRELPPPARSVDIDRVTLEAPVSSPSKIVCVGLNYRDHAAESGASIPDQPLIFAKFPSSIVGPTAVVTIPAAAREVDWEVELAVVISKGARHVSASNALDHVFGYTVANDVSARDIQLSDGQFVRAKSYDTFCPIGPWIITADELGAASDLAMGLDLNGEPMQHSSTEQMVFDVPELISFCSRVGTLNPGDVILTGTPSGTGYGLDPKRYLAPGDVMSAWIDSIGTITNPVAAE